MKELAQIASAVQVSSTMAMDMLAKQMKADGVDAVSYTHLTLPTKLEV